MKKKAQLGNFSSLVIGFVIIGILFVISLSIMSNLSSTAGSPTTASKTDLKTLLLDTNVSLTYDDLLRDEATVRDDNTILSSDLYTVYGEAGKIMLTGTNVTYVENITLINGTGVSLTYDNIVEDSETVYSYEYDISLVKDYDYTINNTTGEITLIHTCNWGLI